jgi:hypothetical protein
MLIEHESVSYSVLDDGIVWVKTETVVERDGVEIARSLPNRFTVSPGEDVATLDPGVQRVCKAIHTPGVVAAFVKKMATINPTDNH